MSQHSFMASACLVAQNNLIGHYWCYRCYSNQIIGLWRASLSLRHVMNYGKGHCCCCMLLHRGCACRCSGEHRTTMTRASPEKEERWFGCEKKNPIWPFVFTDNKLLGAGETCGTFQKQPQINIFLIPGEFLENILLIIVKILNSNEFSITCLKIWKILE